MNKLFRTVASILIAMSLVAVPVAEAQTRGRNTQGTSSGASAPGRTSGSSRPGNNHSGNSRPSTPGGTHRPGNNHSGNSRPSTLGGTHRPGNNHSGNSRPSTPGGTHRPGNNHSGNSRPSTPGGTHRPGNNHSGNSRPSTPGGTHRPGNNHSGNGRPSTPGGMHRPGVPGHAGHRPLPPPGHGHRPVPYPVHHTPGFRHHIPFFGVYRRPVPPPRWHYVSGGPVFGTILGVALGTAIGASVSALVNNGYTVSSYGNDVVYLSNVSQMNYIWPDAAMYYTNGMLTGSQFTYTTPYYDMNRYNSLYNTFVMQYGAPVQVVSQGGLTSATWYGAGGRYVTLSFSSQYDGSYYTTLSFGN